MAKKKTKTNKSSKKNQLDSPKNYPKFLIWILLAVTFLTYTPTFNNQLVNWDDDFYVEKNRLIQNDDVFAIFKLDLISAIKASYDKEVRKELDKSTFVVGNYHPLTIFSLYINYKISGLSPFSYQLFNILLHLINVFLVFLLLKKLCEDKPIAVYLGTALFALHPMHVESVSWVSERKDVLYSLFFLAGLISYLNFRKLQEKKWLIYTFILFLFSCLSKPAAVVFPITLGLLDLWLDRKIIWSNLIRYLPFLLISVLIGMITLSAQVDSGAVGKIDHLNFLDKFIMAGHAIMLYIYKFFYPIDLCAFYPIPSKIEGLMYLNFALVFVLLLFFLKVYKSKPYLIFSYLFFIINLLLVLQIVSVGAAMIADRYTYMPYVGLSWGMGLLFYELYQKIKQNVLLLYGAVAVSGFFALLSFQRTKVWLNSETLFSDIIDHYPKQNLGWGQRGAYYKKLSEKESDPILKKEYINKALSDLNISLEIDPENGLNLINRGNIFFNFQQYDKALMDYKAAESLGEVSALLYTNMGASKYILNQKSEAYKDFDKALELDAGFIQLYMNRGISYMTDRQYQLAINDFEIYLKLNPNNAGIHNSVGLCYRGLGDEANALSKFNLAIKIGGSTRDLAVFSYNRGLSNLKTGNTEQAKNDFIFALNNGYDVPQQLRAQLGF